MTDFFDYKMAENELHQVSSLALAHVGDAVYELMVRTHFVKIGGHTAGNMHAATVSYVSAPAQANAIEKLMPYLTAEEHAVYKRGRNVRVNSVPKGASIAEYHAATGFEALFGYLYLHGERDRLNELFEIITGEN